MRGALSVLPEALGSCLNPGAHGLLADLGSSPARDPSVSSPAAPSGSDRERGSGYVAHRGELGSGESMSLICAQL